MSGDDREPKRPIFTGEDLPPEAGIAPEPAQPPIPPRWDDEDDADDFAAAPSPARLGLDDDERLPWLESADDIDADEGFDSGRVIGFVLLGLVALAMIVGAVWFATNRGGSTAAEGGVIRAERGPYKVAPENPGGRTFEGTGDTSFAVAQGGGNPGPSAAAPTSTPSPSATPTPTPPPTPSAKPSAAASTTPPATVAGIGVQVGAYTSAADAEAGWSALSSRHEALKGLKHRVVEGQADFGRVFRLQAVTGDVAAANALCSSLKASGQGCQVKK